MKSADYEALTQRLKSEITTASDEISVGIIGYTPIALDIIHTLTTWGLADLISGIYDPTAATSSKRKAIERLQLDKPTIAVIASDEDKEALIMAAVPYLPPTTKIVIGGFAHFAFRDQVFDSETGNSLLPSFANGYPNSLIHIYQCLQNAARLNLAGVVAEFGMFKGGTTMLISKFIARLGKSWKVYGFDSFAGFPAPGSALDMYAHPDCVFLDEDAVRRTFKGLNVEIIAGDITQTASEIRNQPIVLAFIDTDNYSSAKAVLDVIQDEVVPGGAIVFDHFTGKDRFLYTLGERIAGKRLLGDPRYFNLHGTGVFLRQR